MTLRPQSAVWASEQASGCLLHSCLASWSQLLGLEADLTELWLSNGERASWRVAATLIWAKLQLICKELSLEKNTRKQCRVLQDIFRAGVPIGSRGYCRCLHITLVCSCPIETVRPLASGLIMFKMKIKDTLPRVDNWRPRNCTTNMLSLSLDMSAAKNAKEWFWKSFICSVCSEGPTAKSSWNWYFASKLQYPSQSIFMKGINL